MTRVREAYGPHARHVGDWWLPDSADERLPTVVLVHGGFWRPAYDLSLEDAVAARGYLVRNVDDRPSSEPWPATLTDAAAAHDHLRAHPRAPSGVRGLPGGRAARAAPPVTANSSPSQGGPTVDEQRRPAAPEGDA